MSSLAMVVIKPFCGPADMSVQDWDSLFSLLITNASFQELKIHFPTKNCDDAIMSVLSRYLLRATSLVSFKLTGCMSLSFFPL
jgi:hypothetical protein